MNEKFFCAATSAIWRFIGYAIYVIKIIVPLVIIVLGVIELSKCVVSGKDDEIKATFMKLIKKLVIGILIFFIPTIVRLVFSLIKEADTSMLYADPCIMCLTKPSSTECSDAVKSAEEARKTRSNKAYYNYYKSILGDKSKIIDYSDEPSGGNPKIPDNPSNNGSSTSNSAPVLSDVPSCAKSGKYNNIDYWLLVPDNATSNMPLIVYLHGGVADNYPFATMVTRDHPAIDVINIYGNNFPFIMLIPHSPSSWYNNHDDLKVIIENVVNEYKINKNNINLAGASNGGDGTWTMAGNNPGLFHKIFVISGPMVIDENNLVNYKNIGIRGISEPTYYYTNMDNNCTRINALNGSGSCRVERKDGYTHETILSVAFTKDIFEWMIS